MNKTRERTYNILKNIGRQEQTKANMILTSAVDHAPDVAIEANVVQMMFVGIDFARVLQREVPQCEQLLVAKGGVVVEANLGVHAENYANQHETVVCRDLQMQIFFPRWRGNQLHETEMRIQFVCAPPSLPLLPL